MKMSRTVDEKYKYNQAQNTTFSVGYCAGVRFYRGYSKVKDKQKHKEYIDEMKIVAKNGHQYGKGFMCAIRDVANERKQNNSAFGGTVCKK